MPSETRPPPRGVAGAAYEVTMTLIPRDDFGEIIYTVAACGGRKGLGRH
jgi:hypothetical protein